jgi:hypothetical protein
MYRLLAGIPSSDVCDILNRRMHNGEAIAGRIVCYWIFKRSNGHRVFPGGKAAGAWRWPPTPSRAVVKEKSNAIPLFPLWVFMACSSLNFTVTVKESILTHHCSFSCRNVPVIYFSRKNIPEVPGTEGNSYCGVIYVTSRSNYWFCVIFFMYSRYSGLNLIARGLLLVLPGVKTFHNTGCHTLLRECSPVFWMCILQFYRNSSKWT